MPTKPSNSSKPKQGLSPNHVSHVRAALRSAKSSHGFHPLVVPPASDSDTDDQMIPASSGEYIIPKEVVARKGTQFFDNLVKKTLEDVMPSKASPATTPARASAADMGGTGTPETGYRWGGEVRDRGDRGGFGGGFWSRFGTPMAMTNYQDAIDPHPSFWGPGGGRPGGPQVFTNPRQLPSGWNPNDNIQDRTIVDNPVANRFLNNWNNFGYMPNGFAPGGPTMIPTFWNNYPGVGYVPMAVPAGGWSNDGGSPYEKMSRHTPMPKPD